ncbi:MAG: hypothetical protein AWU57_200 [Marinobacter sp. T13-3]|nr:MAG: hypothetical protein AWU57_200 [Marinobacter sp. T13-3]
MNEKLHTEVLEKLIQGTVICKWSDRKSNDYLDNIANRDNVDFWLSSLGMQVAQTPNEDGYYTTYMSSHAKARETAKAQFKEIMEKMRFYVLAFSTLMDAVDPDRALHPGMEILHSKLLDRLNDDQDMRNDVAATLAEMPRNRPRSTASNTHDQLDAMLKVLVDDGLLFLANPQIRMYLVTAKWDIIQEMIEFIADHESVPVDDPDGQGEQEALL